MVDASRVPDARAFVKVLEERWPGSPDVLYWLRVLAPPKVIASPQFKARPLHQEYGWLRSHANEYPGQWLSIYEDRLIAAGQDLQEVVAKTREVIGQESALLSFVPGATE